jgi:hypothetical protein
MKIPEKWGDPHIKLILLVWIVLFFVMVSGCASRIPELAQDCEIARYEQAWEGKGGVAECKMASERKEDRRVKKAEVQARKDACVVPYYWDSWSGLCRDPLRVPIR